MCRHVPREATAQLKGTAPPQLIQTVGPHARKVSIPSDQEGLRLPALISGKSVGNETHARTLCVGRVEDHAEFDDIINGQPQHTSHIEAPLQLTTLRLPALL